MLHSQKILAVLAGLAGAAVFGSAPAFAAFGGHIGGFAAVPQANSSLSSDALAAPRTGFATATSAEQSFASHSASHSAMAATGHFGHPHHHGRYAYGGIWGYPYDDAWGWDTPYGDDYYNTGSYCATPRTGCDLSNSEAVGSSCACSGPDGTVYGRVD